MSVAPRGCAHFLNVMKNERGAEGLRSLLNVMKNERGAEGLRSLFERNEK